MTKRTPNKNSIPPDEDIVKEEFPEKIKVLIHIPANVAENTRMQKINRIYDILSPKTSR